VVRTGDDWLDEVRGLTGGRGVEVFDHVGGDQFLVTVRSLRIAGAA
jgi:NADPH:quinone reductase-like Zn-dependent oxidoreductase